VLTGDPERDRWQLWLRVLDHDLVAPPHALATALAERAACGDALWAGPFATLSAEFPDFLAQPRAPLAQEIRRVASAAWGIGQALHALHCRADDGQDGGQDSGQIAMWLTLAAAGMDHLVDDGVLDGDAMRRYLAPGRVIETLRGGPPVAIPGFPWVERTLERGLGLLGERMRAPGRDAELQRELCGEIEHTIRTMLVAQLRSSELVIGPHAELARVRTDLRAINALTVWIGAYGGLLGHARPAPATLDAVRRIATLFGDVGWALDALSDIHDDLAHGVFSLVWLELAERTGLDAAWLIDPRGRPDLALQALAASPVIEQILVRLHHQLAEIDRQSHGGAIATICRYMVAAFLYAEPTP
jgi:hypothetical protein